MKLVSAAKEDLRLLLESEPGERFRDRYRHRRDRRGEPRGPVSPHGLVYLALGTLVFLFGMVMFPLPGPGWAICLLGLGLVAGEYDLAARFLDGPEMLARRVGRKLRRPRER